MLFQKPIHQVMQQCKAAEKNNKVFREYILLDKPEGYSKLNDSNIELIKAFSAEYPDAMCIDLSSRWVNDMIFNLKKDADINYLNNFCYDIDIIFNAEGAVLKMIKEAVKEYHHNPSADNLKNLWSVLEGTRYYNIIWS